MFLQYELALATRAEMDASEQLQRTMDDMRPHGENLKGFSLRVLRVTNDLLATYQVYQFLHPDSGAGDHTH